ncbi:MAG: preprotein translocase subunit SecY [Firmicutes bacterium]|nr:preprotein translocase subunit SecY [Bacillota bacterium]
MWETFGNLFRVPELRRRLLATLGLLVIFRIGSNIAVPNVDPSVIAQASSQNGGILAFMDALSGGALSRMSIFAMSVYPYVTASIIVQLLSMDVIPTLTEWAREGEAGRRRLTQLTRYLTAILGAVQAAGFTFGYFRTLFGANIVVDQSVFGYAEVILALTAGTVLLMWLGEMITEYGIGNGISIVIMAGIVSRVPAYLQSIYQTWYAGNQPQLALHIAFGVILVVIAVLVVAGVVYMHEGVRRIPVQYSRRVVGRRMYAGQQTHIPIKVNASGVIPIIFASSLLYVPVIIAAFFPNHGWATWIGANLNFQGAFYNVLYALLIVGFTFFYTYVQINPMQLADDMKKYGGFIPGVRPGRPTEQYITRIMNRITVAGAVFLAVIAIIPSLFIGVTGLTAVYFGGTALLIMVGVTLDTMKQLEGQLVMRHYHGFIR